MVMAGGAYSGDRERQRKAAAAAMLAARRPVRRPRKARRRVLAVAAGPGDTKRPADTGRVELQREGGAVRPAP
ncbi:Hypothetical predicted protein [Podarcis lilfordi]|uniref:Uncharacterized protein n=1 Tax=Podarcis lilfordi TaxID=74358 RepID=A0AA35K648_9SAUR|nr:Hypothetical predicted protein [Podarcis lilfordi]